MTGIRLFLASFAATAVLTCGECQIALADNDAPLQFMTHASAYAHDSRGSVALDPHVFVTDQNAPDDTGPEGIHHFAGFRPARPVEDPSLPLYNAQGDPIDLSVGHWFEATGTAILHSDENGPEVSLRFRHLVPFGVYSLFLRSEDGDGNSLIPLDGDDTNSTFTASGNGDQRLTVPLEHPLSHATAIVLVYHSDGQDHHSSPGDLGIDAHEQLVVQILPEEMTSPVTTPAPQTDATDGPSAEEVDGSPQDSSRPIPTDSPSPDSDQVPL